MTDDPARFAWEEDHEEGDELLYTYGYHKVRGFEGVWQHGRDGEHVTASQAMLEIMQRREDHEQA